jgi:hypothetical protein
MGQFHVLRDGQNSLKREVRVLDVLSVHFFICVQHIGVLELFNRLFGNL